MSRYDTFTFTFISHLGKTHNHRSRGDTPWRAQTRYDTVTYLLHLKVSYLTSKYANIDLDLHPQHRVSVSPYGYAPLYTLYPVLDNFTQWLPDAGAGAGCQLSPGTG